MPYCFVRWKQPVVSFLVFNPFSFSTELPASLNPASLNAIMYELNNFFNPIKSETAISIVELLHC